MIEIRDAVRPELAERLRNLIIESPSERKEQYAPEVYLNRVRLNRDDMPAPPEVYTASFHDSAGVNDPSFSQAFTELKPILETILQINIQQANGFLYRMDAGDHFRIHTDGYFGRGFVLYLSKGWKWDWGGLLMVEEDGIMRGYLPRFNNLVVLPGVDTPHFVSAVAPYAGEPRYTMVGFVK